MALTEIDPSPAPYVYETLSSLPRSHIEKLPFDINDYLNFELNEDFISISGDFMNGYADERRCSDIETDEDDEDDPEDYDMAYETEVETEDGSSDPILKKIKLIQLQEGDVDIDIGTSHPTFYESDDQDDLFSHHGSYKYHATDSCPSSYTPSYTFIDTSTEAFNFGEKSKGLFKDKYRKNSLISDDNNFTILDIHHEDFQCSVMNSERIPCKDSILCSLHSYREKYNIPRSEDLDKLIRNYNYLKDLNTRLIDNIEPGTAVYDDQTNCTSGSLFMKRHNSYTDDLTMISHDSQGNLFHQRISFDSVDYIPSNRLSPDVFAEALSMKLLSVDRDPDNRLAEFLYRNGLKNYAVSQLYQEREF